MIELLNRDGENYYMAKKAPENLQLMKRSPAIL
jgi:hypothetical protein